MKFQCYLQQINVHITPVPNSNLLNTGCNNNVLTISIIIPVEVLLQRKLQGETKHDLPIDTNTQILVVHLKNPKGSLREKLLWK